MVQTIGIMIGTYIITRMLDLMFGRENGQAHVFVRVVAVLTMLVNALLMGVLLLGSAKIPQ